MKKIILIFTALALAGATTQTARADSGWCTVGKVLTGVAAGVAIGQAIAAKPVVYTAPAPVYYSTPVYAPVATYPVYSTPAPRVVYTPAPAPVVVYRAPVVYAAPVVCPPRLVSIRPSALASGSAAAVADIIITATVTVTINC